MTLQPPSKRFQCLSVEENKLILVELIAPSIWAREIDIAYSYMSKEEAEVFDEYVLWKVIVDGKETYMPKSALKPFFEKEAER